MQLNNTSTKTWVSRSDLSFHNTGPLLDLTSIDEIWKENFTACSHPRTHIVRCIANILNHLGTAICDAEALQIMCGLDILFFPAGDIAIKLNLHLLTTELHLWPSTSSGTNSSSLSFPA